jgi:hypothetical protein
MFVLRICCSDQTYFFISMKILFSSVLSALLFSSIIVPARAQVTAPNGIYLELLGNGLLYTINYDRFISDDISLRAGFEYIGLGASDPSSGESASVSMMLIPITFNYFFASHNNGTVGSSKLELGAGVMIVNLSASATGSAGTLFSGSGLGVGGTATVGYRYQPSDGGFIFRIGFTPLFGPGGFVPFGGLSLGYAF